MAAHGTRPAMPTPGGLLEGATREVVEASSGRHPGQPPAAAAARSRAPGLGDLQSCPPLSSALGTRRRRREEAPREVPPCRPAPRATFGAGGGDAQRPQAPARSPPTLPASAALTSFFPATGNSDPCVTLYEPLLLIGSGAEQGGSRGQSEQSCHSHRCGSKRQSLIGRLGLS